ncbi:MAG: VOC family protein [Geminicoccaceae bacterium]
MAGAPVELDHLFVMVRPGAPEAAALAGAGLYESFRRDHPGQGTTNLCYCFDNAYLELLWLDNPVEAPAPPAARLRLAERADWQTTGASPFGIALRTAPDEVLPFATWHYAAPFLPAGASIPMAVASDDPRQPLLFRSPGSQRPDHWTNGRAGARQTSAGLAEIAHLRLDLPDRVCPAEPLTHLQEIGLLSLGSAPAHRMVLTLSRPARAPRHLTLPAFTWSD